VVSPPLFAFLFASPLAVLAAAGGAVSIPIIIHLLSRRRYRVVSWAAMRFLLAAQKQSVRRMRLEQILVNLVSNAIRHSPAGRAVVIRVQGNAHDTAFEVHDQGPGVPEELREKIFEPFERFDPLSGTGSGLGLPLSRRLAEILGGKLSVENPAGRTVFRLVLPLEPPADV